MSDICKYCNKPENKQKQPGLVCEICHNFVHLSCLKRLGTPGDFTSDVFFDFTCESCSPTGKELFVRNKFPWVNVIILTLHHLNNKSYGISNHGYFHYKTHICSFIDRNWHLLFGAQFKQKKNWVGTIAGALSIYSGLFFRSGSASLGESGWWSLLHFFSPAVAAHIVQELAKVKGRPRNQTSLDRHHFTVIAIEMGYKELINEEVATGAVVSNPPVTKKRRLDWPAGADADANYFDSFYTSEGTSVEPPLDGAAEAEASDDQLASYSFAPLIHVPPPQSDTSSINSYQPSSAPYYDSDSRSRSPPPEPREPRDPAVRPDRKKPREKPAINRESLFSVELNSVDLPWVEKREEEKEPFKDITNISTQQLSTSMQSNDGTTSTTTAQPEASTSYALNEVASNKSNESEESTSKNINVCAYQRRSKNKSDSGDLVEMTPYEEIQLLKQVESLAAKTRDPTNKTYLNRLKAKLTLRRLKRHRHLPLFDLDKTVRRLAGAAPDDRRTIDGTERVLDRFQRSYLLDNLCGTVCAGAAGAALVSAGANVAVRSPYSGALLKPYIRRDARTEPLWLRLMDELLRKTHRHIKDYVPPARAPIEYSYVRAQHIPALNNLCATYFWPGIDLSEALQYPEFSCVVTYKKLVIGCAFLVPDVRPNEAYVSFLVTRPEWQKAKIGSFMLYHLLQTCSGKDVTLHVSPTNPAIFLYQKFGFKVEELIQDFYEKYFDVDYKGCRHALFLRLVR